MSGRTRPRAAGQRAWVARACGVGLALLHLPLLAGRIADDSIFEPLVLARWLAAALALGAAFWLHARGIAPWKGRAGVALTLVVLLLHLGAGGGSAAGNVTPFLLPAGLALTALFLGLATHADRAAKTAASARLARLPWQFTLEAPELELAQAAASPAFAPRPPPGT